MNDFNIEIAGRSVRVIAMHGYVKQYCEGYLTDKAADFAVEITQGDIDFERERSRASDIKEGIPVRSYHDEYLETLAVYRQIADRLIDDDTILFHGSVIAVDGAGYLFTAKSGTGKSTHTRLWRERFGSRAVMINDDKPLLHLSEGGATVFGTPWNGKHRLSTNTCVPLKAVCIIGRAEQNSITRISKAEGYDMLVQQTHKPNDPQKLIKTLRLIDKLADEVGLYRLYCNMDISAADIAYEGMQD